MAEYIERTEELIVAVNAGARAIENTKRYHGAIYCMDAFSNNPKEIPYLKAAEVLRGVDEIPPAKVKPVVYGDWWGVGNMLMCTVCDKEVYCPSNFCPNCGADMRGETT